MDGTFFLGEALLPGALEFLDWLNEKGIKFTFLTNNTSKGKQAYVSFLTGLVCALRTRASILQAMRPSVI
jgi:NagD protein